MNIVENFRDLGGIVGHNGKKIKQNRILRSAALIAPIPDDFNLTQVIDFRTDEEASKNPDILPKGVNYIRANILMDGSVNGPRIGSLVFRGKITACYTKLLELYTGFVTSEAARAGFSTFIKACLACNTGATLFHCVAGKDRTGFAAAVLLKILGVSDADIMTDYMQTEEARREATKRFLAHYRRRGLFFKKQQEALAMIMGVKPEYLQAAFESIQSEYESFDRFLAMGLGVTPQDVQHLRDLYLEA